MMKMDTKKFEVVVLAIIFDPAKKKILIGKRENDPNIPQLGWCFPGGRIRHGDEVDKVLKQHIKNKTGYTIKNLGTIFSKVYSEKEDLLAVYFLTEVFEGKEKPGEDIVELKWVSPDKVEKHFKTSFNSRLKEYLMNLI
jgi:ADP-ribose pyrophosphatase YjhB (NUDIX family)